MAKGCRGRTERSFRCGGVSVDSDDEMVHNVLYVSPFMSIMRSSALLL